MSTFGIRERYQVDLIKFGPNLDKNFFSFTDKSTRY